MSNKKIKPYESRPTGFHFVARNAKFPEEWQSYTNMCITEDGTLAICCSDNKWYPLRKATPKDIEVSKTCCRTWDDVFIMLGLMPIAA